jgi:type II secretory pathway pseudopilin PulG
VTHTIARNQEGFTLVEVMVGFVIVAGAIIMTFQVFSDGLRALNASQTRAYETIAAQHQIDQASLFGRLTEGTKLINEDGVKLRVVTSSVNGFEREQFFLLRPYKLSVFRDDGKDQTEPILETILIAKPATP